MLRPTAARAGPGALDQAGVALPVVLWLIVLLVGTVGAFALASRIELLQGKVQADGAQAQEIARAGIEYAMARVDDSRPQHRWVPDGRPYRWSFADAEVELRIVDEAGKVDLNHADPVLLAALLRALGTGPMAARQLAGAIVDWRDADALVQPDGGAEDAAYAAAGLPYGAKDAPFESVAELQRVRGMTPELFARMAANVTLLSGLPQPDAGYAPAPVRAALGLDATASGPVPAEVPGPGSGTYSIQSTAKLRDGREVVLRATLRRGVGPVPGAAFAVVGRETGDTGQ